MDVFSAYERGLAELLTRLGVGHPRYAETLTLQARLRENVSQARRYGDTESRRAERAQVVEQLNVLALAHCGISFNELCLGARPAPRPETPLKSVGAPSAPKPFFGTGPRWAVLVGINY